jgi:hypothetical protein
MELVQENNRVFIIDENKNKVSKDFGWIFESGAVKGESNYFIATEETILDKEKPFIAMKDVKWAIYELNTNKKLTDEFDWISTVGVVKGQSAFFRGTLNKKEAIFTLEGRVSEWFDKIRDKGVLTGESFYFWGKSNKHYALYHIKTGEKLTPDFKSSVLAGAVLGRGNFVVGSFGEEIFFIYDIVSQKIVSPEFDEDKLIEILKHGDLDKALKELTEEKV